MIINDASKYVRQPKIVNIESSSGTHNRQMDTTENAESGRKPCPEILI